MWSCHGHLHEDHSKRQHSKRQNRLGQNWFKSYLHLRQVVNVNGKKSNGIILSTGIAQGTFLGPMLLIFYINDIGQCM